MSSISPTTSAGRKAAVAGLIGSAALTAAGLATHVAYTAGDLAGPGTTLTSFTAPAASIAQLTSLGATQGVVTTGNGTNVNPGLTPTVPVSPAPQSKNGDITVSGGGGFSVPFDATNGFGPASIFGKLDLTPPPPASGDIPLNFDSSTFASLFSPSIPASSGLPQASSPIFELFPTPQLSLETIDPTLTGLENNIGNLGVTNVAPANTADTGAGVLVASAGDPFQAFAAAAAQNKAIADSLTPVDQQAAGGQDVVLAALTPSGQQPPGPTPIDFSQPGSSITVVQTPNGPAVQYDPGNGGPVVTYGANQVVPLANGQTMVSPSGTNEFGNPAPVFIPNPNAPVIPQDTINQLNNNMYQETPVPLPVPRPPDPINTNPYEPPTDNPGLSAYAMNNTPDGTPTGASGTPTTSSTPAAPAGTPVVMTDVPDTEENGPGGGGTFTV